VTRTRARHVPGAQHVTLARAEGPLRAAIERMLAAPREHRCFVIIEDDVTERFVQFLVDRTGQLVLDLPVAQFHERDFFGLAQALTMETEGVLSRRSGTFDTTFQHVCGAADDGVVLAMTILRRVHALPDGANLSIVEESTSRGPGRN
jgi:hypothetical protein